MLTGACLSRTGLNRKAAYATLTMVVAAEFPDVDMLWGLRGPVDQFQHHRGITHAFLGLPFEAALLVAAVYGWHRWRVAKAGRGAAGIGDSRQLGRGSHGGVKPLTVAPVRWGVLYVLALLALSSHLLLDYTNSYGIRPFFPFNDRWYAASIVFIFDPVMFVMLLGALTAPWLFGLIGSEVGAKKQPFRARGWAIAALLGVVGWWGLREVEHGRAMQLAMAQSIAAPSESVASPEAALSDQSAPAPEEAPPVYLSAQRALANPDLLSPFRWSTVMDFGPVYQLGVADTQTGELSMGETTYPKPGRSSVVLAAEGTKLGRAYIDWSPMPFVEASRELLTANPGGDPDASTVVTFRDPRFMGGWMGSPARSALSGTVTLNAAGKVVQQAMGGRVER